MALMCPVEEPSTASEADITESARPNVSPVLLRLMARLPAAAHASSAAEAVRIGGLALRLRAARGLRHEPAKLLRLPSVGLHLFLGKTALQPQDVLQVLGFGQLAS